MAPGWHPYPMVRILGPLAAGILWGSFQDDGPSGLITCSLFIGLLFLGFRRLENRGAQLFGVGWMIFLFLGGWFYVHYADPLNDPRHWRFAMRDQDGGAEWTGKVKFTKLSGPRMRATVAVNSLSPPGENTNDELHGDLLVYFELDSMQALPRPGESIWFVGKPTPILPSLDPIGFDWQWYQRVRGVTHQLFLKPGKWTVHTDQDGSLRTFFHDLREKYSAVLSLYLSDPEAIQLAKAVILGDRDEMSGSLNEGYQASGAVHILAVSGLHVGLVAGLIMPVLGFLFRRKALVLFKVGLSIAVIWGYIGLTGAADSAIRAGVLFSFIIIGRAISRSAESLNLLAAAVVCLLLVNPWMIHHVGFQLSVFAVAGILFFHPLIYRMWYPGPFITRFIWSPFSVTVAAQLATLMLSLYFFHRFPVYFLLSGIFVVPLAGLFLASGLAVLFLHFILPVAAFIPGAILGWTATLMNALVLGIADLPGASVHDLYPQAYWSVLLPVISGLLLFALAKKHPASLVLGTILLAGGIVTQVFGMIHHKMDRDWYIIRRQSEPATVLVKHGSHLIALDFSGELDTVGRAHWPGYGSVWKIPASINFKMGEILKKDQLIHLGQDSLSWGTHIIGNYHLLTSGDAPDNKPADGVQIFLAPDLDWKEKRRFKQWGEEFAVPLTDLKETGYFKRSFD